MALIGRWILLTSCILLVASCFFVVKSDALEDEEFSLVGEDEYYEEDRYLEDVKYRYKSPMDLLKQFGVQHKRSVVSDYALEEEDDEYLVDEDENDGDINGRNKRAALMDEEEDDEYLVDDEEDEEDELGVREKRSDEEDEEELVEEEEEEEDDNEIGVRKRRSALTEDDDEEEERAARVARSGSRSSKKKRKKPKRTRSRLVRRKRKKSSNKKPKGSKRKQKKTNKRKSKRKSRTNKRKSSKRRKNRTRNRTKKKRKHTRPRNKGGKKQNRKKKENELVDLDKLERLPRDKKQKLAKECEHIVKMEAFNADIVCDTESEKYRTMDGSCNNKADKHMGKTLTAYRRLLEPMYDGDSSLPPDFASQPAVPAMKVTTIDWMEDKNAEELATSLCMDFGQFLDHDCILSPNTGEECPCGTVNSWCFPVDLPKDNVFGVPCFETSRSMGFCLSNKKLQGGKMNQFNSITPAIDGSAVHGSSKKDMEDVRYTPRKNEKRKYGSLKTFETVFGSMLPHAPEDTCFEEGKDVACGIAGDFRANEQPGLATLHTIFMRLHNLLAGNLAAINKHWDDEQVYQEARKILGAVIQKIAYKEYLPVTLGTNFFEKYIGDYTGYKPNVDMAISAVFATSAFRFGHSQIPNTLMRCEEQANGGYKEFDDIELSKAYFNAKYLYDWDNGGIDSIVCGMTRQKARKVDLLFGEAVKQNLFASPFDKEKGLDLVGLNANRALDHGVPRYTKWLSYRTGEPEVTDWNQLVEEDIMSADTVEKLQAHYTGGPQQVGPFIGLVAEKHGEGSLVGETLGALIGEQFKRIRDGDRFFYKNEDGPQAFSKQQIAEIERFTMARVLCLTSGQDKVFGFQENVFKPLDNDSNRYKKCNNVINLNPWREK